MQIQLKQPEIVAALRQYISTQGINLSGKSVDIGFVAGRGESGLTATILIEEAELPELNFEGEVAQVINLPKTLQNVVDKATAAAEAAVPADDANKAETAEATEPPAVEAAPAKTSTSLFG